MEDFQFKKIDDFVSKKYQYRIDSNWFNYGFNWLNADWNNGRSVWFMVQNYTRAVHNYIINNYLIDIAEDPEDVVLGFLVRTGVFELVGDIPKWAKYLLLKRVRYIKEMWSAKLEYEY